LQDFQRFGTTGGGAGVGAGCAGAPVG
jgi:hypothetical protein